MNVLVTAGNTQTPIDRVRPDASALAALLGR